jgi:hypothetical protein
VPRSSPVTVSSSVRMDLTSSVEIVSLFSSPELPVSKAHGYPLLTPSLLLLPRSSSIHSSVFDHSHRRSPSYRRHLMLPRLYGCTTSAYTVGNSCWRYRLCVSASVHRTVLLQPRSFEPEPSNETIWNQKTRDDDKLNGHINSHGHGNGHISGDSRRNPSGQRADEDTL